MKIENLQQYIYLKSEIKNKNKRIEELEQMKSELESRKVMDVVTGSSPYFPYLPVNVHIDGITNNDVKLAITMMDKEIRLHRRRVRQLLRSTESAIKFIDSVEDSLVRQALQLRYIENYKWEDVAAHIGGNSRNSIQMAVKRYFEKNKKK